MEAARQRVEVLERELSQLLPEAGAGTPLAVEVLELRRKLLAAEDALREERERRKDAEEAAQAATGAAQRMASLEESLERVQAELQRRRREGEGLWRRAAQADMQSREAEHLRAELKETRRRADAEARRADVAEVSLIRTQMRLAIERARPQVDEPWPAEAPWTEDDALRRTYARDALVEAELDWLRQWLPRLALLMADLMWNSTDEGSGVRELFELLQDAGNPLEPHDDVRLGPRPFDAPGLRVAIGPLALQVAVRRHDDRQVVVTVSSECPLEVATVSGATSPRPRRVEG